jgi:acyl-CoA dehydrogenase
VVSVDFEPSERAAKLHRDLTAFMDEFVYPGEERIRKEMAELDDPHAFPPALDELKAAARSRGLWNLFLTNSEHGPGLTNVEYAPLAEIMGHTTNAAEVCNCAAPDTGNMEVLALRGSPVQQKKWLQPLLDGVTRSTFSMTEPAVASSDATNLQTTIQREGDDYVVDGRKWFSSGAMNPRCEILIVMGVTDPSAERHRRHSMIVVPRDTEGVTIVRSTANYGYEYRGGHCEIVYDNVRVPAENLIGSEGDGFEIAQARLGPGRIHHAMRLIGMAEVGLELMIARARARVTFGRPLIERDNVLESIARSRIEINQVRLSVLHAAWAIDQGGPKRARKEIAEIKISAPRMATRVLDRAIQLHGAAGVTSDVPLAEMWAHARSIQIADGPDEVHLRALARMETATRRSG